MTGDAQNRKRTKMFLFDIFKINMPNSAELKCAYYPVSALKIVSLIYFMVSETNI